MINSDFHAGLAVGRIQAALLVEKMSVAGDGSKFAKAIRKLHTHEDLKLNEMIREGKIRA